MHYRKMIDRNGLQTAAAWCAGCAIGYLLLSLLGSNLGQLLVNKWLSGAGAGASLAQFELVAWCCNLLCSLVALLVPVVLAMAVGGLPAEQLRLQRPERKLLLPALLVYLGGSQIISIAASFVGSATGSERPPMALPESKIAMVIAFLVICAVPAVLEELLFRGAMQAMLRPYGLWLAIVGQAVPFALLHGNLASAFFALAAGVFLGWLAERSDSLLPGMLLHFINNSLAFVQLLLLQSGAQSVAGILNVISLLVFPVLGVIVLIWWIRQGGLLQKLERVSRVDRLFYSVPWVIAQIFLVAYCIFMA